MDRTGMIGSFSIIAETASSSGVRRIEAVTGRSALEYAQFNRATLDKVAAILKIPFTEISSRVHNLLLEKRSLADQVEKLKRSKSGKYFPNASDKEAKVIKGAKLITNNFENCELKEMRLLTDQEKNEHDPSLIINFSKKANRLSYTVGVSKSLVSKISAVEVVKMINLVTNGNGGGRPDFAQGGGTLPKSPDGITDQIAVDKKIMYGKKRV